MSRVVIVLAVLVSCLGCGSSDSGGSSGPSLWTFYLYNETEGLLDNVVINGISCPPLGRGENAEMQMPTSAVYYAESVPTLGYGLSWNGTFPQTAGAGTKELVLDGAYYSLWVENKSSYVISDIWVDHGLPTETHYSIIHGPGDKLWYGFFDRHLNANIRLEEGSGGYWSFDPMTFQQNAAGSYYFSAAVND